MGKLILVTGGARSGKSSFAEKYVAKYGKNIAYIATSQVLDEEMAYSCIEKGVRKTGRPVKHPKMLMQLFLKLVRPAI